MTSKVIPSNPVDVMVIRSITPDIVTLSTPFLRFGRLKIGGRGTIVRFQTGSLLVFSPVALTSDVQSTIESLGGNLKYIVAPDILHHIFLTPWKQAYPNAQIIAPEGLREKREQNPETKGLDFPHIFTAENRKSLKISDEFDAEFDVEYVASHPSREIVLYHKRTGTVLEADLLFNLPATEQYSKTGESATTGFLTRIFVAVQSTKPPGTWQKRIIWYVVSSKDRKGFGESMAAIDKWDFDRLIPCHGDVIETGAKEIYQRMFDWFLKGAAKRP